MIQDLQRRLAAHGLSSRRVLLIGCCLGFAALGLWLAAPLLLEHKTPVLRMSAGPEATRRHQVAAYFAREAARNGVVLRMEANTETEASLEAMKAGKLDLAIVSSGVVVPEDDDVMVLGAIQLEAVHLLVRSDLPIVGSVGESIHGKRVNVGEKGSTEHLLANDFLRFARLRLPSPSEPGDIIPTEFSKAELTAKALEILKAVGPARDALIAELPECLLVLDSTPAALVQKLIAAADYKILPMPATRAYIADSLQESTATSTVLLHEFLEPATILARSYFKTRGFPEADCETLGVRLLVVARKDVPAYAIRPLMKTLFEGEFARRIHSRSPRELATTYAIHPAAIAYLDRDKPLPIHDLVEKIKQVFSLFGAFSALGLSLYGLIWRKKVRKPTDYFAEIRRIELLARGAEVDSTAPVQPDDLITYLDNRLQRLRQNLIEDICEGRIKGDQVITNILALLNETRLSLQHGENVPGKSARAHSIGDARQFRAA